MISEPGWVLRPLSLEEYLDLEAQAPLRHELVEGIPHAMAWAGRSHNLILTNLALGPKARAKGWRLYLAEMKLKVGEGTLYYPDLMVVCTPPAGKPLLRGKPLPGGGDSL